MRKINWLLVSSNSGFVNDFRFINMIRIDDRNKIQIAIADAILGTNKNDNEWHKNK